MEIRGDLKCLTPEENRIQSLIATITQLGSVTIILGVLLVQNIAKKRRLKKEIQKRKKKKTKLLEDEEDEKK